MPLDPLAKAFLDQQIAAGVRPTHELSVDQARRQHIAMAKLQPDPERVERIEDREIPRDGAPIPVRIYTPVSAPSLPILVYFHGGGWVVGTLDANDARCCMLANAAQCIVVSVEYRHAPEFKFPIPVEDAFAATAWVAQNAALFNGDPRRIGVGGASAGGNLAAVVALMARDRGAPRLIYQLLMVPITNYAFETPSYRVNADGYGLTREAMRWYWDLYLASPSDGNDAYASPLRAASLEGLPPAHVLVAEYDPLHDEGEAYAKRLAGSNVPTVLTECSGMVHGFLGDRALELAARYLREGLERPV